jgi:hypothetical protein
MRDEQVIKMWYSSKYNNSRKGSGRLRDADRDVSCVDLACHAVIVVELTELFNEVSIERIEDLLLTTYRQAQAQERERFKKRFFFFSK